MGCISLRPFKADSCFLFCRSGVLAECNCCQAICLLQGLPARWASLWCTSQLFQHQLESHNSLCSHTAITAMHACYDTDGDTIFVYTAFVCIREQAGHLGHRIHRRHEHRRLPLLHLCCRASVQIWNRHRCSFLEHTALQGSKNVWECCLSLWLCIPQFASCACMERHLYCVPLTNSMAKRRVIEHRGLDVVLHSLGPGNQPGPGCKGF